MSQSINKKHKRVLKNRESPDIKRSVSMKKLRNDTRRRWRAISTHSKRGTLSYRIIKNSGDRDSNIDRRIFALYEILPVAFRQLSFYAESILIMSLRKIEENSSFPNINLIQISQTPISEMSIRGKHINFLLCARYGHLKRVKTYVKQNLIDLNWTFTNENNCLHEAVLGNQQSCFDFILSIPYIDFDYPNSFGFTPLTLAALARNYYFVFKLIIRGADPDFIMKKTKNKSVNQLSNDDPKLAIILREAMFWRENISFPNLLTRYIPPKLFNQSTRNITNNCIKQQYNKQILKQTKKQRRLSRRQIQDIHDDRDIRNQRAVMAIHKMINNLKSNNSSINNVDESKLNPNNMLLELRKEFFQLKLKGNPDKIDDNQIKRHSNIVNTKKNDNLCSTKTAIHDETKKNENTQKLPVYERLHNSKAMIKKQRSLNNILFYPGAKLTDLLFL